MPKPSLFIGSSSERLEIARAVEFQLQSDTEVTIWNEGFFDLGHGYLETLVNALDRFDFAILALTSDDLVTSRDVSQHAPRDNVMFELGLFMGRLGRSRTFVLYEKSAGLKIPSDLAGVTHAAYDGARIDGNLIAAVSPACTLIRKTIKDLGFFEGKSFQRLQDATNQVEQVSDNMERLIHLLARSRIVELEVTAKQFGSLLPQNAVDRMNRDLKDLEEATRKKDQE